MGKLDDIFNSLSTDFLRDPPKIVYIDYSDKLTGINKLQSVSRMHRKINSDKEDEESQSLSEQYLELDRLIKGEVNGR